VDYLKKSPYRLLNNSLACRNTDELEHWKPFLFYLISALKKLPNFTGTVYRALDRPLQTLSKQYKPGNSVVWVAFTSTSKNRDIMTLFTGKSEGTLMRISVVEGKEISQFSLFPSESEVLLPPNTFCFVDEICTENMKDLLKLNNGIDALILTQTPTPKELKLDFGNILSENYKQLLQKEKEKNRELQLEIEKLNNTLKSLNNVGATTSTTTTTSTTLTILRNKDIPERELDKFKKELKSAKDFSKVSLRKIGEKIWGKYHTWAFMVNPEIEHCHHNVKHLWFSIGEKKYLFVHF